MKVKALSVRAGDVLLVPGDLHFDQQDQAAIDVMLQVAEAAAITDVCLVGDTFESTGISRHPGMRTARKFRKGKGTIKQEEAAARPTITALRDLVRGNRATLVINESGHRVHRPGGLHVLTGNHEAWWAGVQDEFPGLLDTPWFELYGDLFDGWQVHEEYTALRYANLLVCHGHRLRGSLNKNSAAAVLANYPGQNTMYGHTHRIDQCTTPTFKYGVPSCHGAFSIGGLKDRDIEIKDGTLGPHSEKHQQGFAITHFFDRGDGVLGFDATTVRIHRDHADKPMAVYNGEVFRG